MIYRYDGTWTGFLTTVAIIRERGGTPAAITRAEPEQAGLFDPVVTVETDPERAGELRELLARTLSPGTRHVLRSAFQAEEPGMELLLFHFLELGLAVGCQLDGMLAHERVLPVWKLARAVGREAHRYKGLVRFQEVEGGFWYAAIEPDHRILPLIAPHFAARFADQQWIIHDPRRGESVAFDPARRKWAEVPLAMAAPLTLSAGEELFRDLWRRYFDRLAIGERLNPKLQRQQLPLKHRRHLPEFERGAD
ncbi:TIGR03915 family putative DNA repair protein [Geobacter pickeringii]|uniref:DUF4130 domain-containing protein n=1 Tax=Geobacter pickeringii TaxID=345632 RepID=A0A0B5BC16_9BACT|nr:TIGR03915 family putative DNA repair protein [Geobacter pickeringii]AJE02095.1 hypothetical protein GPICK_00720 [Geobacter pickeringii]